MEEQEFGNAFIHIKCKWENVKQKIYFYKNDEDNCIYADRVKRIILLCFYNTKYLYCIGYQNRFVFHCLLVYICASLPFRHNLIFLTMKTICLFLAVVLTCGIFLPTEAFPRKYREFVFHFCNSCV